MMIMHRSRLCVAAARVRTMANAASQRKPHTWESLGLVPELAHALRENGFAQPSTPQKLVLPPLLAGKSVAYASSTGSGKTLGFLLPMMQHLREEETQKPSIMQRNSLRNVCSPRALVLAPTRDLVAQIGTVAKSIAHSYRLRIRTSEGGSSVSDTKRRLRDSGADVLIATPQRLARLHRQGIISLRRVRHVAVDEADELLLRGFDQDINYVLSKCPPRDGSATAPQLSFVSATLGGDVQHVIQRSFPGVELLIARCAHRPPTSLTHELVGFEGNKLDELRRILLPVYADGLQASEGLGGLSGLGGSGEMDGMGGLDVLDEMDGGEVADGNNGLNGAVRSSGAAARPGSTSVALPRTLVFCRGVQSARAVQHTLESAGVPVGGYHGAMPENVRKAYLAGFLSEPPTRSVLVCTDLSARGVDFPNVETVVNFDFPATSALYLHRAGRTARMGRAGHVLSLVHPSERRFAESIRDAVERKAELHTVRKGDLRERQRARGPAESRGKAAARQLLGQEVLRVRGRLVKGVARASRNRG